MNKFIILIAFACLGVSCGTTSNDSNPIYKDANQPVEKRVGDLVSRMTLEEKILQINQYTLGRNFNENNVEDEVVALPSEIGSVIYFNNDSKRRNELQKKAMEKSRLGIPVIFGFDVIHGFRTVYQISLGQACSWNTDLVKRACAVAAKEARVSGVDWTFSPMVDVARDGRWGRVSEGYGEDVYTNSAFSVAAVQGYQGDDNTLTDENHIAACLKHYVGYGASEGGRDYAYTEISNQTLWDTYLPPFEAGVKAGAATLMTSFNDISGTPSTANHYVLAEILREKWKHDGFVVSDWSAIEQLVTQGMAADRKDAGKLAFNAGVDMDMTDKVYSKYMAELVEEGKVKEVDIDESVRRILRIKFRLGLFENPYTPEKPENERLLLPEYVKVAEKIAAESFVLLKNENNTLPLTGSKKIALVGPMADNKEHLLGNWYAHGRAQDVTSIYEGFVNEFGKDAVNIVRGCDFEGDDKSGFAKAISAAKNSDVVVVCLGEKRKWSGENCSRSTIVLPEIQEKFLAELKKAGKPIVLILSSGRPLELCNMEPLADAIMEIWQPGVGGANPLAQMVAGKINPSGKLSITFPYSSGQIPIYYNMRSRARRAQGKYQNIPTEPLYEFAHGLSYTTYEYGELKLSAEKVAREGKLSAEITVKNVGDMDGLETVHWFISDPSSSITRPVKELKYFDKQLIKAGKSKTFRFDIDLDRDFSFVDSTGEKLLENGDFYVMVKDQKVKVVLE